MRLDRRPLCLDSDEIPHRSENDAMCQLRTFLGAAVAASGTIANRVFGRNQLFLRRVRWRRTLVAPEAGHAEIAVREERAARVPSAGILS
jgi:hypothetical protein